MHVSEGKEDMLHTTEQTGPVISIFWKSRSLGSAEWPRLLGLAQLERPVGA